MIESTSVETERLVRLERIRDIAAEVFSVGPDAVEAAGSFATDLETDSLLAVDFLCELEKHFALEIDTETIPQLMSGLQAAYDVVAATAGW